MEQHIEVKLGWLQASLENIRLAWNWRTVANALAYYDVASAVS